MNKKTVFRLGRDEWRKIIDEQGTSGLSVPEYCRQKGMNEKTFYNRRKRLLGPKRIRSENFIQIKALENRPGKVLNIQTPGGYRLEVHPGIEISFVQNIMKILAEFK